MRKCGIKNSNFRGGLEKFPKGVARKSQELGSGELTRNGGTSNREDCELRIYFTKIEILSRLLSITPPIGQLSSHQCTPLFRTAKVGASCICPAL